MGSDDGLNCGDPAPITALLREATWARHLALHQAPPMRRLFAADYGLAEYRNHVALMLGVVEPLERAAVRALETDNAEPAGNGSRNGASHLLLRSRRLCADLRAMGASTADIARLPRYSGVAPMSPAGVGGYVYVTLGSMLGGRLIARQVQTSLGPAASVQYYAGGAGGADERWTSFCADLDAAGPGDFDAIRAAALATFDAFGAWLAADVVPAPELAR